MYVQVRTIDAKISVTISISKLATVVEFKKKIEKKLDVKADNQRLFFRGKQLEEGYKLFDYNINLNDVVQLIIKADGVSQSKEEKDVEDKTDSEPAETYNPKKQEEGSPCESEYFKIGDYVDAKDSSTCGSWFEAKVIKIFKDLEKDGANLEEGDDGLLYKVEFRAHELFAPVVLGLKNIRPMCREIIPFSKVNVGDTVMVNYNLDEPKTRGFWYDMKVAKITKTKNKTVLEGSLFVGTENTVFDKCVISFTDEIMKIEEKKKMRERTEQELKLLQKDVENKRKNAPSCPECLDNPRRKCKACNCAKCGNKNDPEKQVLCDECNMCYHIWCVDPVLTQVPESEEWYCTDCKNDETEIVKAGEKLKASKKKLKMPSANSTASRDWGKGMACVGRTKECTLVPQHHFGEISGVEVGTLWKFRVQVSESGIHRPHVAGIHGRESDGAYSIVLSRGYEDDIDNGDEFIYSGSGERNLSGNKRTAEQSCDQTLTRMNKALAMNCNAPLDTVNGAKAKDWKGGKPVRVVRNFKISKHSKYAPKEGNRYDGIYKVVKYYPSKGKSGFIVWRYVLRRDDPTPAPWTKKGKQRIASLGIKIIYPEGYLAAIKNKDKKSNRRHLEPETDATASKKQKVLPYKLESNIRKDIESDVQNSKRWKSAIESLSLGKRKFLEKTVEEFMCICCQELVHKPITTPCKHNICTICLQRSFSADVYSCPSCREELGKNYTLIENKSLQSALNSLFPRYNATR